MRNTSHDEKPTFTGALRSAIESWRKSNGWSRETVVMHIVEAHDRIGGPSSTGIVFDPPSRDTFERAKANADRVFRWLDDVTKDTNPCPPNFIPSILSALPLDRRMDLVNEWLCPVGICCRPMDHVDEPLNDRAVVYFKDLVKTSANAQTSVADLLDGIDPGELERAQSALLESMNSIQHELGLVEQAILERNQQGDNP